MHKIVKIALVVFGLIGAILWFQLPEADMPDAEAVNSTAMNFMFIITYILLGIAVVVSLGFALKNLLSTPATLKKALFSIGGFAVIAAISYFLATGTDVDIDAMAAKGITTDEGTIKMIGAGLNLFFGLVVISIVLMIVPGVKKVLNK